MDIPCAPPVTGYFPKSHLPGVCREVDTTDHHVFLNSWRTRVPDTAGEQHSPARTAWRAPLRPRRLQRPPRPSRPSCASLPLETGPEAGGGEQPGDRRARGFAAATNPSLGGGERARRGRGSRAQPLHSPAAPRALTGGCQSPAETPGAAATASPARRPPGPGVPAAPQGRAATPPRPHWLTHPAPAGPRRTAAAWPEAARGTVVERAMVGGRKGRRGGGGGTQLPEAQRVRSATETKARKLRQPAPRPAPSAGTRRRRRASASRSARSRRCRRTWAPLRSTPPGEGRARTAAAGGRSPRPAPAAPPRRSEVSPLLSSPSDPHRAAVATRPLPAPEAPWP